IIMASALLAEFLKIRARAVGLSVVIVLLAWMSIEAVRIFPNHITYMNQLARNAPHWWYLSDSNVEWGDDIHGLAQFLQARGENRVIDGTLGGFGILRFYQIQSVSAFNWQKDDPQ